jgi:TPR repeat protein
MKTRIVALILGASITAQAADRFAQKGLFIGGGPSTLSLVPYDPAAAERNQQAKAALDLYYQKANTKAQEGVEARVILFLQERIENGSADAAYDLAVRHTKGLGVDKNPEQALILFRLAAERGNSDAQSWLATNLVAKPSATNAVPLAATNAPAAQRLDR